MHVTQIVRHTKAIGTLSSPTVLVKHPNERGQASAELIVTIINLFHLEAEFRLRSTVMLKRVLKSFVAPTKVLFEHFPLAPTTSDASEAVVV